MFKMYMDEREFQKLLQKNPKLRVHTSNKKNSNNRTSVSTKRTITPALRSGVGISTPKYGNQKVYIYADGYIGNTAAEKSHGKIVMCFDSNKEYYRYLQLTEAEKAGIITALETQKLLLIQEGFCYNGKSIRPITYKADFAYLRDGKQIIEDVKGKDKHTGLYLTTEVFNLKWKLLKHRYPEYCFEIF